MVGVDRWWILVVVGGWWLNVGYRKRCSLTGGIMGVPEKTGKKTLKSRSKDVVLPGE